MINSILKTVAFYKNSFGDFSTKRKLVVFESDDWGSIRMPNNKVYQNLKDSGFDLTNRPFERFDSVATNEDLSLLFELLASFRDSNNNHPVITANVITGNPDFVKIKKNDFQEFFVEEFIETLKNYDTNFALWEEGIKNKVFFPQFHGREHLNVPKWMHALQEREENVCTAFDYGLMGIPPKGNPSIGNLYQIAFDLNTELKTNRIFLNKSIKNGIEIFEKAFNYKPLSFIAPVYTWDSFIENELESSNVKYIQGGRFQTLSNLQGTIKHNIGEKKNGFMYNVRNAFFEPSTILEFDHRAASLEQLKTQTKFAFLFNKPLVISVHRLNFVGRIDTRNRDVNLELFKNYIKWLLNKHPDVEFLNTVQLMEIIENENSYT
ncbi:hypothetical protein RCH18_002173 [Flavobacterium sp. PL11]|uniref:hypothetical protein n=1 Tax=Flavobacterium sp. PL11 TaxID=3071717 RepID=UPI002DFEC455|nr:hypothetical protein [Flavobacterium sp. PL11]